MSMFKNKGIRSSGFTEAQLLALHADLQESTELHNLMYEQVQKLSGDDCIDGEELIAEAWHYGIFCKEWTC